MAPGAAPFVQTSKLGQRLMAGMPERPRLLLAEPPDETVLVALAALAPRAQRWLIADTDIARIDRTFERLAKWAANAGLTATWPARALLIHAPGGAWRIEGYSGDPAEMMDRSFVDAVIVDRPDDAAATWRAYRQPAGKPPLLACRCATGRIDWLPPHRADTLLRPPAPARSPDRILRDLRDAGCAVAAAVSDWHVPANALSVVRSLVEEAAGAAPAGRHGAIAAWEMARRRQTLASRLAVRMFYRDILALPPQE